MLSSIYRRWALQERTADRKTLRKLAPRQRPFVPRLEPLEDRSLPSTFTVTNMNDSGPGSLRAAVLAADAHPGPDTINFKPGLSGTIRLTTVSTKPAWSSSLASSGGSCAFTSSRKYGPT